MNRITSLINKPWKRLMSLLLVLSFMLLFTAISASVGEVDESLINNDDTSFPRVQITTHGSYITYHGAPIHRDNWSDITMSLSNTAYRFENRTAQIRGRGNTSWSLPKQPFRIRFSQDYKYYMLDSDHAARHWTFIANHSDKTLLRNYSAYYLASLLEGMYVAPFARFVDVYFNNEYWGVYMLSIQTTEMIEGRINLTSDPNPANSEFLIEMDARAFQDGVEGVNFVTVNGRHYDIRYPSGDSLTSEHVEYVRNFITQVDKLARSQNELIFQYIHVPSFVDFYIVQELYKNQDVGFSSVFMQIRGQGDERRLEMGPVWDFDISAGNAYYQRHDDYCAYRYRPEGHWVSIQNPWYRGLMQMPYFFDAVSLRWNEVRNVQVRQTIEHIKYMADKYQSAFERNFERWPILGTYIWPSPASIVAIDSFGGQVEFLINFLERRSAWLDAVLYCQQSFNSGATETIFVDGIAYEYFYTTGIRVRQIPNGLHTIGDRQFYYIEGVRQRGWVQHGDGRRYFYNQDNRMQIGWQIIDWYLFFFDPETGIAQTDWLKIDSNWHFFLPYGEMVWTHNFDDRFNMTREEFLEMFHGFLDAIEAGE